MSNDPGQETQDAYRVLTQDETEITVTLVPGTAFMVLSAIQLARKHPQVSQALRISLREFGMTLEGAIAELHPGLIDHMAGGWELDVIVAPPQKVEFNLGEEEPLFDDGQLPNNQ